MNMSENLRKVMELHKISQKTLALKSGIPASTIHGWLNGVPPKNIVEIKKVASLFSLTVDELCFGPVESSKLLAGENIIAEIGTVELVLRHKDKV
jgi:transcriptional regulator with XRE-family HTH domain